MSDQVNPKRYKREAGNDITKVIPNDIIKIIINFIPISQLVDIRIVSKYMNKLCTENIIRRVSIVCNYGWYRHIYEKEGNRKNGIISLTPVAVNESKDNPKTYNISFTKPKDTIDVQVEDALYIEIRIEKSLIVESSLCDIRSTKILRKDKYNIGSDLKIGNVKKTGNNTFTLGDITLCIHTNRIFRQIKCGPIPEFIKYTTYVALNMLYEFRHAGNPTNVIHTIVPGLSHFSDRHLMLK